MREVEREQLINIISLLKNVHKVISRNIKKDVCLIQNLIGDCQEAAIVVENQIEKKHKNNCITVSLLEQYCEMLYQLYRDLHQESESALETMLLDMDGLLERVIDNIYQEVKIKRKVVFLPYKASMWDSFESVWKTMIENEDYEVYVVPIPYFDRNGDGSFGNMHYEGELYPDNVPITNYKTFDLEEEMPDVIYIHNPYDEYNKVTSVHPSFYSKKIKNYTEELIYIPYFVLCEIDPDNKADVEGIKHFIITPGVINANKTIVQSEAMKKIYVNVLVEEFGEKFRDEWNARIEGSGSPKVDKVVSIKKEDLRIPEEWLNIIEKSDKSWKKIVFYNTSLSTLLQYNALYLDKMENVLSVFKRNTDEVALLWRPHPLMHSTIESMRPELKERYSQIVQVYKNEGWGIYDDSVEFDRAIGICDAYYGDWSSVVELCKKRDLPILVQNIEILERIS